MSKIPKQTHQTYWSKLRLQVKKITETTPTDNISGEKKKIKKLESEIDVLMKQIFENVESEQHRKYYDELAKKIEKEF